MNKDQMLADIRRLMTVGGLTYKEAREELDRQWMETLLFSDYSEDDDDF